MRRASTSEGLNIKEDCGNIFLFITHAMYLSFQSVNDGHNDVQIQMAAGGGDHSNGEPAVLTACRM